MATTTGQHQLTAFTTPVNGTSPIDADEVRTNDATIRTAYNAHDADTGIHVQSSVLGSRPAAGTSGRKWLTVDALSAPTSVRAFYDDGTNWYELSYLSTAGGTIAGNLTVNGTLTVGSTGAFGDSVTVVNALTVSRANNEVDLYLIRTGTSALTVYLYNGGTAAGMYDGTNLRNVWVYTPAANTLTVVGGIVAESTLSVTGAITASSTINGQTISSSASLTGTLAVAGIVTLTGSRLNVQGNLAEVVTSPTDAGYTGSVYQSIVTRAASTAYDHFYATANSVIVARIRGDGSALFSGAVTVSAGGAAITGNSTVTGTLAVAGGSTSNAHVVTTTGTVQQSLRYDGSNRLDFEIGPTGEATLRTAGAGGGIVFASNIAMNGTTNLVNTRLWCAASDSAGARFQLQHGTAPSAPNDGDMWTTSAGLFVRVNGATVGPLS